MVYVEVEVEVQIFFIVGSGRSPVISFSVREESADQNMRTCKGKQQGDKQGR
jgi:hypothetical protein